MNAKMRCNNNKLANLLASELFILIALVPLVAALQVSNEAATGSQANQRAERVTVLAPKYLRPHSDYHVLVSLAESQVPATIDLQITGARDSNREQIEAKSVLVSSGETQTLKFTIGDWPPAEYTLSVNAQAVDRSWSFNQEATLAYQAKSYSAFVQTDKAIYKPGQLVQFRVIFLRPNDLGPLNLEESINVTVSDAKQNVVKQWNDLSNYRGLLSLELRLSDRPVFGDWTIKVSAQHQEINKQFRVAEYILPTFEVDIQLPNYVTYNDSDLVATVKASYTYGKPVNGHLTLTVQPLTRYSYLETRPLAQVQYRQRVINGTADVSLDVVRDLKLSKDLFEREIEFFALVEEDLTGRKYNKTKVMKIHDKHVKIERLRSDETFKPGLGYLLQMRVAYQDDTPVEDNGPQLELQASSEGQVFESAKLRPVGGLVEYQLQVPKEVRTPDGELIRTRAVGLQAVYRGKLHYLKAISSFRSKSDQYIRISLPQLTAAPSRGGSPRGRQQRRSAQLGLAQANVNEELRVQVEATEPMQVVTCQGLARGDIIWAVNRDAKNASKFDFQLKVDQRMAPRARIICFYIRPENKEMIADSVELAVGGLVRNLVKVTTSRTEAKPGQEVEVGVLTKANSLVGLLAIDQSVLLLRSGNDVSQEDLANELASYGQGQRPGSKPASDPGEATDSESLLEAADVVVLSNSLIYGRNKTSEPAPALIALADYSRPLNYEIDPPEFHLNKPRSEPLVIRSFFPETWIWANATAGPDGRAIFSGFKAPDTITSWVLSAFSINEQAGFGLSAGPATKVRVFRPFFIRLNLPYSLMRGETAQIQAVIFNYSKRPSSAKVTLENRNGDFEFVEAANNVEDEGRSLADSESRLVQVASQDGAAVSFLIRPRKVGPIEIRLTAQSDFAGDAVVRKLTVKPEGQAQLFNRAMFINLAPGDSAGGPASTWTRNISIDVPANAVPGSQRVSVSAVGDILGAGLGHVDDLLRLPYGGGEQNMINLVPNIVLVNYLQNTGRLREAQRVRALRNIESGYQSQLAYKRPDGSFSAFGSQDANGSVWLTAYVLKSLQQAKSLISVDDKVIRRAANFISRFSRSDGSIEEPGMVHNKNLQSAAAGAAGDSEATYLTAYAVSALLQRPIKPDPDAPAPKPLDEVIERGLDYLERQLENESVFHGDNPYQLAAITYALQLANRRAPADRAYEQLWRKAHEDEDGLVWWEANRAAGDAQAGALRRQQRDTLEREFEPIEGAGRSVTLARPPLKPLPNNTVQSAHLHVPNGLSIETSSLALLSALRRGDLERGQPVVRWLISQQNSQGGFASTQDTVLAIEALAAYAEAASVGTKTPLSMEIDLVYPRERPPGGGGVNLRKNNIDQVLVTQSNALVNQQTRLPDNTSWVQIRATGSGSAIVQVSWQYNLLVSAERPAFYLNPILDKSSNINYLQLSVCTFYKAGDASNLAVMEVELPSGYLADVEALPSLTQTKGVKRVDTTEGDTKVLIYFDRVTRDETCITVPAHRSTKVSNSRPVPVTIYDYYNRQQAARIFYEPQQATSCDICEPADCGEQCSRAKPKRAGKLISLHEQRKISLLSAPTTTQAPPSRFGNLIVANSTVNGTQNYHYQQILPLAPVLVSLLAIGRNFTHS